MSCACQGSDVCPRCTDYPGLVDPEACPGCGCLPGDGLTDGCEDQEGCGYARALQAMAEDTSTECETCGTEERVTRGRCAWCAAHAAGAPHGRCEECDGARLEDGSCACRPKVTGRCRKGGR